MTKNPTWTNNYKTVDYLSFQSTIKSVNYFNKKYKQEFTKIEVLSYAIKREILLNNKFNVAVIYSPIDNMIEVLPSIDELMKILDNFEENYPKKAK